MGGRVSKVPPKLAPEEASSKVEDEKQNEAEAKVKKVLLLGTGECGKSTLFKHLIKLYGNMELMEMDIVRRIESVFTSETCRIRRASASTWEQ
jgi:energy-coupling factor transporter ATP-binding protein EcfA2